MLRILGNIKVKTYLLFTLLLMLFFFIQRIYFTLIVLRNDSILLWWTPFIASDRVINCDNNYSCLVTSNRKFQNHSELKAFLFYGSNLNPADLPVEYRHVLWSIFHEESPKNLGLFLHEDGQSIFNLTATFDRRSDFPTTLQYLKTLDSLTGLDYYVPLKEKNAFLTKFAPVLYIQSDCDTPIERDKIVAELMKYIQIDSYGNCLNNKQLPESLKSDDVRSFEYHDLIMRFIAPYKFIISIENAECEDYITEKLWRPLIVGSIPIYLGSPNIKDWLPNNQCAILVNDFDSIKSLANYIDLVNKNDKLYQSFLDHKEKSSLDQKVTNMRLKEVFKRGNFGLNTREEYVISAFECFVCEQAQKNEFKDIKKNIYNCPEPRSRYLKKSNWKEHWKLGKCEGKALKNLLEKGKNYTKGEFEQQVDFYYKNKMC